MTHFPKKLGATLATLMVSGGVIVADISTLSLGEIKAEKTEDYKRLPDAPVTQEPLKTQIRNAILNGTDPQYPAHIIAPHTFAQLSVEVATEMGVDMTAVSKRLLNGEEVLLSKEIRIKAKEKGVVVKSLQK